MIQIKEHQSYILNLKPHYVPTTAAAAVLLQVFHFQTMAGQRSHSAAPCDSPSTHVSRSRSKSPRCSATDHHRSLSPPDCRRVTTAVTYGATRFQSRSATATPTGSPKKRQLPQVPQALAKALQERVTQDLEASNRNKMR